MTPPSRLADPRTLDDLLLYRMARALQVAGSMVIRLCEGRFGITRREWRVLALLAQDPVLLSSELAERAQLDRARTSRAITSLVAKKLVRRETGLGDRRQARLALTDAGQALYDALFPLVARSTGTCWTPWRRRRWTTWTPRSRRCRCAPTPCWPRRIGRRPTAGAVGARGRRWDERPHGRVQSQSRLTPVALMGFSQRTRSARCAAASSAELEPIAS